MILIKAIKEDDNVEIDKFIQSTNNLNVQLDNDKRTPLIYASIYGKTEIVQKLIDAGAKLNYRDIWGDTALISAAINNHPEIVNIIYLFQKMD